MNAEIKADIYKKEADFELRRRTTKQTDTFIYIRKWVQNLFSLKQVFRCLAEEEKHKRKEIEE